MQQSFDDAYIMSRIYRKRHSNTATGNGSATFSHILSYYESTLSRHHLECIGA